MDLKEIKVGIIGLGYVGLPLAIEFSKKYPVVGYDIKKDRVNELLDGIDRTNEVDKTDLIQKPFLRFSNNIKDLEKCNFYIVTVPTPIDLNNNPDLSPLISASSLVGKVISKNNIVVFESTVYPGATEEDCIPIVESESGLILNESFFAGYSPERINPGDKTRKLSNILKVTSGSTHEAADFIDLVYSSIIDAGTYKAPSIKVAEAAKVIENTQRYINIALLNELSRIFSVLNIDTSEVLKAASTKWNFLNFQPGLVGGHCIGVDPYYLTYKSQLSGYEPEMILSSLMVNEQMPNYIVDLLVSKMKENGIVIDDSRVLILGLTFKENCPDLRNTKVINIIKLLRELNIKIDVVDPQCSLQEAMEIYNIQVSREINFSNYDAILIAVPHKEFLDLGINFIKSNIKPHGIIFDFKSIFEKELTDLRL